MSGSEFTYQTSIAKEYTDFLGHLNNAFALKLLEDARLARMKEFGMDIESVIKEGLAPVSLEITISFKKEIKLGEEVTVRSVCQPIESKVMVMEQSIFNKSNVLCCSAKVSFAMLNMKERKIVSPNELWLKILGF